MRKANKLMIAAVLALALPTGALAAEADLQVRIDQLTKQMDDLKGQVQKMEDKQLGKWLTIGGKYEFRVDSLKGDVKAYTNAPNMFAAAQNKMQLDFFSGGTAITGAQATALNTYFNTTSFESGQYLSSYFSNFGMTPAVALAQIMTFQTNMSAVKTYAQANTFVTNTSNAGMITGLGTAFGADGAVAAYKPKNETLYTNKFSIDLKAQATKDVTVNARLGMYKTFGSQNDDAVTSNAFFADRTGVFDGTLGHIPSDSKLNVDRAYATWNNIGGEPVWFSVGRRPSTDGGPTNFKNNTEKPGTGGTPALLVNYAFDGMTIGYAPDIDALPGFYGKICYGRGFDSGFTTPTNSIKDTDMFGVAIVPIDTDPLRVWLQYNRGMSIFDFPVMENTAFGNTAPSINLGDIDWYGIGAMSTFKNVGPGNLNVFADLGLSVTHPNQNVSANAMFQGLLTGAPFSPEAPSSKTGYAALVGARYDLPSKTKLGFEFNHGSKNWITFAPSADDMWTSKVGTRGNVYEPYIIQELDLKPISSRLAKAFFKVGFQYYDFDYTGSNNWVGAPIKISELATYTANYGMLLQAPVSKATDIYGTFTVEF